MFIDAFKRVFAAITKHPFLLLGLTLLCGVLMAATMSMGFLVLPLAIIVALVFSIGMSKVYIEAIGGREIKVEQLFDGFKNPLRSGGGMAWMTLWSFIWLFATAAFVFIIFLLLLFVASFAFLPNTSFDGVAIVFISFYIAAILGDVFLFYKMYSYSLTPYILAAEPEVKTTDALRLSKERTKGKKRWMLLADIVLASPPLAVALAAAIFNIFSPAIALTVGIILAVIALLWIYFGYPVFRGLYTAFIYEKTAPTQAGEPTHQTTYEGFASAPASSAASGEDYSSENTEA